jgi:hypothetical protein
VAVRGIGVREVSEQSYCVAPISYTMSLHMAGVVSLVLLFDRAHFSHVELSKMFI